MPPDNSHSGKAPRLGYMPGLDGIRALAVLAIIFYHSGFTWIPGGYYSVDAFFALSGFLITSLLVTEWQRSSTISLSGFWARRARRLLPGLFVMLAGVGILSAVWPGSLASPDLRADSLFTLFYVANWHFIAVHANYFFATAQPSPLLHTWTLAIEEQFYIVWPLVVTAVLRIGIHRARASEETGASGDTQRRARLKVLFAIALVGAAGSACLMGFLYKLGGDPTRVYYGTDTRAQSLLIGAALAIAIALWKPQARVMGRRVMWWAGIAGMLGTAALWSRVTEGSALAFRGGFALAALATAGVIACAAYLPESPVARVLAIAPLRGLGKISYGVYLWYWPTLLVVNHAETGLTGYPLVAVRIAVVVSVAIASYYLVEMPIRRGALPSWRALVAAPVGAGMAVLSIFTVTALVAPPATASVVLGAVQGTSHGVDLPVSNGGAGSTLNAHPVKVLLVGDSMAGSLGVGLQVDQSRYGVQVVNEGSPGCSLGMDADFKVLLYTSPPGPPCVPGSPAGLLRQWQKWVDTYNPDVAVYFARADLMDQSVDGRWENVGMASYDTYLTARLDSAVKVLSSKGAHVVLLTSPYYDSGEQPSGEPWPEDTPARVVAYNKILHHIGSTFPKTVTVLDTGAKLSPGAHYSASVDGITLRCTDGVHLTPQAGEWLGPTVLPRLAALGASHAAQSPQGTWPHYRAGPPNWYGKLTCP